MFRKLFKKKRKEEENEEEEDEEKAGYETIDEPFNEILEKCMEQVFKDAKKLYQQILLVNKKHSFFQPEKNRDTIRDIKILALFQQHNIYRNVFKKMDNRTAKDYFSIANILYVLSSNVLKLEHDYPVDLGRRPKEFMDLTKSLMAASRCIKEMSLQLRS